MKFTETPLSGAFLMELDPSFDERGSFARAFSARQFHERGLCGDLTEVSISRNHRALTLRGMHYQRHPYGETKLVRVVRGRIFDVIVDIRPNSKTFSQWFARELSAENMMALYISPGFAHGFLTLEDDTDVLYMISDSFQPEYSAGFVWNDPLINIPWPSEPNLLASRDRDLPDFAHRLQ